jgi:hypothetical protein
MKNLFRAFCAVAALGLLIAIGAVTYAGNVPLITGPQDPSQLNATINSVINQGNAAWSPGGANFLNNNSWKVNGTVATTITSLGPTGVTPTTIARWMKILDVSGNVMVIPMWSCPTC